MSKPFTHPGDISVEFVLAVYHVLHNQVDPDDWPVIDQAHAEGKALNQIERLYETNDKPWTEAERLWWLVQLAAAEPVT